MTRGQRPGAQDPNNRQAGFSNAISIHAPAAADGHTWYSSPYGMLVSVWSAITGALPGVIAAIDSSDVARMVVVCPRAGLGDEHLRRPFGPQHGTAQAGLGGSAPARDRDLAAPER